MDLERILASVPTPASGIGIIGIPALLWSASGMMASLRVALTAAIDDGSPVPRRLLGPLRGLFVKS